MKNTAEKNFKSELKFVYSDNDTLSIIFQKNDILLGVVGEFNNNIKQLEKITNTNIYTRGNSILVKSNAKKNELVKNAIKFLSEQFIINGTIEKKDVISSKCLILLLNSPTTPKRISFFWNMILRVSLSE